MKKILTIFFGMILILGHSAYAVPATVDYIFDGDTFSAQVKLEDDIKISVRVRIMDIDAPEISGRCDSEIQGALKAKKRLEELLPIGATVDLQDVKDDKYLGRIDAHVKNSDGIDISSTMIKEKLVRKYGGGKRYGWCE
ncbi:MAG: thermonuclease family protein [Alphaproteobacteria bacterium]|jgi:endonuclease YncB( thermonuclease family)|nr:thermonuclease family protein [Alphaproteobacteria bacterium]